MMAPPVPAQCDRCSKPLTKALLCGNCKAYAYCSKACQTADWTVQHKKECSPLPGGELAPAKVAQSQERADEVNKAERLVGNLLEAVDSWRASQHPLALMMLDSFSLAAQKAAGPACTALLAYRLPPALNRPALPGQPKAKTVKPSIEITLALIARLYLLHDLSELSPAQRDRVFAPATLAAANATVADLGGMPEGRRARLHGPKLVAVPDKLSVPEYVELANTIATVYLHLGGEVGLRREKWGQLAQAMVVMVG